MNIEKKLIVIGGPTASGKTSLSIKLAQYFDCPILSADSRQFYKEMTIGTAKPTKAELESAKHYFIDSLSINDKYTVGDYEKQALELSEELFKSHDILVLVGGSGLFIDALTEGLDEFPEIDKTVKEQLHNTYKEKGLSFLQDTLKTVDPHYYEEVDLNNPMRLLRALEVSLSVHKPFSSFRGKRKKSRPFKAFYFALNWDRTILYNRIDNRVDFMMERGQEAEAKQLYRYKENTALQTVGYKELFDYFEGKSTLVEAIELIKRNSRRYAKRQMTWIRRENKYNLLETKVSNYEGKAIDYILKKLT